MYHMDTFLFGCEIYKYTYTLLEHTFVYVCEGVCEGVYEGVWVDVFVCVRVITFILYKLLNVFILLTVADASINFTLIIIY